MSQYSNYIFPKFLIFTIYGSALKVEFAFHAKFHLVE